MTVTLHELSVSNYLQTLGAVENFLGKAQAHFVEHKVPLEEIVETRLFPDMLPFRFQIQSVVHHSVGAIEGIQRGVFRPPSEVFLKSFSLPNFYFHATTAYDILRSKGVPLGKRDYLGRMRLKT